MILDSGDGDHGCFYECAFTRWFVADKAVCSY
jgi:hypothetical protein